MTKCFPNGLHLAHCPDTGKHMRTVGSLSATHLEHSSFTKTGQHGLNKSVLCFVLDKALSKLTEHGSVKSFLFQFKRKCVLPVNTCSDGICCLAI